MRYCHRVPRPTLDAFIESIWVYQNDPRPHALERILPTGAAQLIVNLKEDQTWLYDSDSQAGGRFKTTSNFYNRTMAAFEMMTLWHIQKTRIAR
jgi:hypothetical protein